MNVSILVATFGDVKWARLAEERAIPSTHGQGALEVIALHLEGGTIAEARNEAARKASGDWLLHLDADDELAFGYLDVMRRDWRELVVRHPELPWWEFRKGTYPAVLLVPSVQYVHPNGREEKPRIPNRPLRPLVEINRAVIGSLVPRALFEQVGGFKEGCEPWEDWELWLRCERADAKLVEVPGAIYRAHVREGSAHRPTDPKEQARLTDLYWRIRREHETA